MFFLTRAILYLPMMFLMYIGRPFKWNPESNLRHHSVKDLTKQFSEKKREHYGERIFLTATAVVGCFFLAFLVWLSGGIVLLIIPIALAILLTIDGVFVLARMTYFQEEQKNAASRNEIVPIDMWKDSSLNAILKRRNAEIDKWLEEHPDMKDRFNREHGSY